MSVRHTIAVRVAGVFKCQSGTRSLCVWRESSNVSQGHDRCACADDAGHSASPTPKAARAFTCATFGGRTANFPSKNVYNAYNSPLVIRIGHRQASVVSLLEEFASSQNGNKMLSALFLNRWTLVLTFRNRCPTGITFTPFETNFQRKCTSSLSIFKTGVYDDLGAGLSSLAVARAKLFR